MKRCCNTDELIINTLHKLGIPSHYKGFSYIKEIIYLLITGDSTSVNLSEDLYKRVAHKFNTTIFSVERSVRYAIEMGYSRANYGFQEELFQNSANPWNYKQTNKEFLITVADKIKLESNKCLD